MVYSISQRHVILTKDAEVSVTSQRPKQKHRCPRLIDLGDQATAPLCLFELPGDERGDFKLIWLA